MSDDDATLHEEFEARFSDLHDGSLVDPARAETLAHLETCEVCRSAYREFQETMTALEQMKGRPPAPETFTKGVEDTIHKRSAGRFFGKKTLGDRVPFGVILVVALGVLLTIAVLLWASATGSLRP
jgi:anti-sigma factor RsiW